MPGRDDNKSRKRPQLEEAAPTGRTSKETGAGQRAALATLEAERSRLAAELEAAKTRIAELEAARDESIDRIAWAIDSLHNLVEK